MVLTRCCRRPSVRSMTSCVNSSLKLSQRTTRARTRIVIFTKIRFVTRATGVLGPRGRILLPSLTTNYSLTSDYPPSTFTRFGRTRPNRVIISCVGYATRVGTVDSVVYADSGTMGLIRRVPLSRPVVFTPSRGLNHCIVTRAKHSLIL